MHFGSASSAHDQGGTQLCPLASSGACSSQGRVRSHARKERLQKPSLRKDAGADRQIRAKVVGGISGEHHRTWA